MESMISIDFYDHKGGDIYMSEVGGQTGDPMTGWRMTLPAAVAAAQSRYVCGKNPVFGIGGEVVNLNTTDARVKLQELPGFPDGWKYEDEFTHTIHDCPPR